MTGNDNRWRKSSYSGGEGGNCVEVAEVTSRVLVRDTKDKTGPMLRFTPDAWRRFSEQMKGARSLASDSRPILQGHPRVPGCPLCDPSTLLRAVAGRGRTTADELGHRGVPQRRGGGFGPV
jgi:Domain of unknown function (DUF397)